MSTLTKLLTTAFTLLALTTTLRAQEANHIVISKQSMTLTLYASDSTTILTLPIACGKNYGDKQRRGDMKTPEGKFKIVQMQDARHWTHDFRDGKGVIAGAYGSHFIRLATPPFTGIGIHGTHAPESIGTRATEGCIRLRNEDLLKLVPHIKINMPVTITPSAEDVQAK